MIGGALLSKLNTTGEKVVSTRHASITDETHAILDLRLHDVSSFTAQIKSSDTVYLLAAYSNPSWIHDHRKEAAALNRDGAKRFINALLPEMPHLIFMSSVEVFDGMTGAYIEGDTPNPLNYYGELKYEIEQYITINYPKSTIVRTGWNIGANVSSRCVVNLTYETLLKPNARMANDNVFSIIDAMDTAEGLMRLSRQLDVRKIHFAADMPFLRSDLSGIIKKYSLRGASMSYAPCRFADILYSEPRGRLNDLDNGFSKKRLGMSYRDAVDVVRGKVALLDEL